MLFPRAFPLVLAAEGKIYVFEGMGSESFGEVYDISWDIWEPLSSPPEAIDLCVPVLDSSRSRILVHCNANDTLYAYYYDRKSWVCLEQKFCYCESTTEWHSVSVGQWQAYFGLGQPFP
ncbi:hypothetical protein F383_15803 [Gossypium arboreum]|uniref:Uncharacterized protein n=1 Tax=Gossypium arboreum TaxID=29729 RepID=A0A0B0PTE7_GOSAR|nr:hypothetical protein F383_15803 [Gossypium arboreum]